MMDYKESHSMSALTADVLVNLQAANLPVATCKTIGLTVTPKEGADEEAAEAAQGIVERTDKYFASFTLGPNCPGCGRKLIDGPGNLFGTCRWGFQYGEGFCTHT